MDLRIAAAVVPVLLVVAGLQLGWVQSRGDAETPVRGGMAQGASASEKVEAQPVAGVAVASTHRDGGVGAPRVFNAVFRTGPQGELLLDAGAAERLAGLLDREHADDGAAVPEQVVVAGLTPARAAEALALLQSMRRLRADETALFTRTGRASGPDAAAEALRDLAVLRQRHFGDRAQALFGAEQERAARQIESLRQAPEGQSGGT